jgi:hypothetical protein
MIIIVPLPVEVKKISFAHEALTLQVQMAWLVF